MPIDRAAESYAIYSLLMPLGETAGKDWPHQLWLVQDVTVAIVPPDQPCSPPSHSKSTPGMEDSMNPHVALHPGPDSEGDFAEILNDFDRHCHERLTLDPAAWKSRAPVRLLNENQQKQYMAAQGGPPGDPAVAAKYKGAPALYGFSQVYFNAHHTVALVYATHWCGGLCGQGFWVGLQLVDGQWKHLNWNSTSWIS